MGLRPCTEWCVYGIHGRPGSFAWFAFDFQSLSSLILTLKELSHGLHILKSLA